MRNVRALTTVQLVIFLVLAAIIAVLIAKVLGFVLSIVFAALGYVIAFILAVLLLSWLWGKISGHGRTDIERYDPDRMPDGRRRY